MFTSVLIPFVTCPQRGTCCCHTFPVSAERCPPRTPPWEGRLGLAPPQAQGLLRELWWARALVRLQAQPIVWWGPAQDPLDLAILTLAKDPQDILRTTCTKCIKYKKFAVFSSKIMLYTYTKHLEVVHTVLLPTIPPLTTNDIETSEITYTEMYYFLVKI